VVAIEWTLEPGDAIVRTELHNAYGVAGKVVLDPSRHQTW
jgi:hypothetical protein